MKSKQNGITLIALSITIVVLLILASVSIATLTGDSGVVDRANDAKVESEIDTEKDILDVATMGALQRSRKGEIEKKYLQEELNINPGKDKYELTGEETFVVTFKESGRKYKIYNNGEVSKINDNSETIEIETSKVTKDESGNIEAETLLTGTKAYIQINVKELEGYSISTQPSTPYKIDKNGEYDFTIIAKKGDEEINKEYKMKVGNYVDNPSSWIDFGGNSHIEFGSDSINQEDFHSNYTIGAKVKLKVDDIKKKNYMGVFGNDAEAEHLIACMQHEGVEVNLSRRMYAASSHPGVKLNATHDRMFVGGPRDTVQQLVRMELTQMELNQLADYDLCHTTCYSMLEHEIKVLSDRLPLSFDFSTYTNDAYIDQIAHMWIMRFFPEQS